MTPCWRAQALIRRHSSEGHDGPVQRVLEADDPRRAVVHVVDDGRVGLHVLERQVVVVGGRDGLDQRAAQARGAARLVQHDVGAVVADDALRRPAEVCPHGHLVPHGS